MKPRNVIIDCDTGVDDALALLLALRSPQVNVLGITNTTGNVTIEKVVRNTLVVVEHSGKTVPVYEGAYRPLIGSLETAEDAHGQDGFGGVKTAEPKLKKSSEHAVDYLVRTFMEATEPIDLITLAPLTNIALALEKERKLAKRINSLTMMAGGINYGNSTPAAEFNVYADPEAAAIVFSSDIPNKTMVALDPVIECGMIFPEDVERVEAAADKPWCMLAARLMRSTQERYKAFTGVERPITPPDLEAVGVYLDPSIATAEMMHVVVETGGMYTRGMTVVDRRVWRKARGEITPNINTVWTVDNARYRKLVVDTWIG